MNFVKRGIDIKAPHFVFWVRDYLEKKYGPNFIYGSGLNITSTLDLDLNDHAQQIIQQTYRTTEVFICAALIYLFLNFVIVRLLGMPISAT